MDTLAIKNKLAFIGHDFREKVENFHQKLGQSLQSNVIGPMEKGMAAAKLQAPPAHVVEGVDLRVLPKFICYKAALLRERLSLQFALALVVGAFLVLFITSRFEVSGLYTKLRSKEYILAPGVQDFTPVSPQMVPDSHVFNAAMDFLQMFGTFSATNLNEQYARLSENMSPELRVQFELEAQSWRAKVKDENISQILSISEKEIRSANNGFYQLTAIGRKDTYANGEHLGSNDVVIEMVLRLIPPQAGKRWYLEITKLTSQDANAFKTKTNLGGNK